MPVNWITYRLLSCATPGLEPELAAFDAANASFSERVTLPVSVLFALVSPREGFDPKAHGHALEANIRFCDFFLQMFGENTPDPAFPAFVDLAIACTADPAFPMRSTVVLFRNSQPAGAEAATLRDRFRNQANCQVYDFDTPAELAVIAEKILTSWYALIQAKTEAAGSFD